MYKAFTAFVTSSDPTLNISVLNKDPLVAALTPMTYVKASPGVDLEKLWQWGLMWPEEGDEELFLGAMTVFRFFPDELIERYNNLPKRAQSAIRNIALTVHDILAVRNTEELITGLVPAFDTILALK